ncbi:MAG: hypothetical protein Ct9H300mP25_08100 [Acidobacteriota bacterium]|nr:MAG: hypothetical protein Ct9H300mP25_08100 [Acidobacteriota bacterium]
MDGSLLKKLQGHRLLRVFPISYFTRVYLGYSLDESRVSDINPFLGTNPELLAYNPFLSDAFCLGRGKRIIRKLSRKSVMTQWITIFPKAGNDLAAELNLPVPVAIPVLKPTSNQHGGRLICPIRFLVCMLNVYIMR